MLFPAHKIHRSLLALTLFALTTACADTGDEPGLDVRDASDAALADTNSPDDVNPEDTPGRDLSGRDSSQDDATTPSDTSSADAPPDTGAPLDTSAPPDTDAPPDTNPPQDANTEPDTDMAQDVAEDVVEPPADDPNELITDRHFARGFVALDTVPGAIVELGTMNPAFAAGDTVWQLGQWGSHSSLDAITPVTLPSGAVRWEDAYGSVTIGPRGTGEADLALHVNAYAEYGGVYRTADATETWPHLLGQQALSQPETPGPGCPPLAELAALDFSVDGRLLFDHRNIDIPAGYDSSRHAADYLMYFLIQNRNATGTTGYGDFLWFGITLYGDRNPMPGLMVAGDDFSQKLIYNIGLAPLSSASLDDGQWHTLSADFLPHILLALQEAWSRGYLSDSHNYADYRVSGMNLGWEVPGLNDTELQIRDLSLVYTEKVIEEIRTDFNTDGDTEGWTTANLNDPNGGPVAGTWTLTVPGSDPVLVSPALAIDAGSYPTLSVTMANDGNPADGAAMQVFWSRASAPGFSEPQSTWVAVENTGGWATYTIDLAAKPSWTGQIDQIRIDPIMYGDGHTIGIDSVVLSP